MKRRKNKKAETFTVTAKRFMISCILILSMTELNINEKTAVTFNLSLPEKYRDYLYFLPAPLSGIFWLIGLIP